MEKASQNSINDLMEKFNRRSSPDRKNDQKQNNRKKKTAINTKNIKPIPAQTPKGQKRGTDTRNSQNTKREPKRLIVVMKNM